MNPRQFLLLGGVVLLLVGLLGFEFIGLIGPTAEDSIFGDAWWFDDGENWAHTILGVVAIIAGLSFPANAQRGLTFLVGLLGIFFGVYNLFSTRVADTNLENPADTILHFAVGAWALFAASRRPAMAGT
ncbi:MAG TPA: hypothetical protein VG602_08455 [Actinomycetota bacterium]|nr:hypothetical protein [Actinomycetota bacterium]